MGSLPYKVLVGDARRQLRRVRYGSCRCCVTSVPFYRLRDYEHPEQIGLEQTVDDYVEQLVAVFRGVRDALTEDGTLWLNVGDSYNAAGRATHGTRNGHKQGTNRASAMGKDAVRPTDPSAKPKDLLGVPWRLALALQADGWYLRSDVVWAKLNAMPEGVRDRPAKSHEYLFMLTVSKRYLYHGPRPNVRSVWAFSQSRKAETEHTATFPQELPRRCIQLSSDPGDCVLDPFSGEANTGRAAIRLGRRYVGIEIDPKVAGESDRLLSKAHWHSQNSLFR